jgi:hypothetical protein
LPEVFFSRKTPILPIELGHNPRPRLARDSYKPFGKSVVNFDLYKKGTMKAIDNIKNNLIDRILATKNEQLLTALNSIFDSTQTEEVISLSSEQIEMLSMSEKDIETEKYISESELKRRDLEWLG